MTTREYIDKAMILSYEDPDYPDRAKMVSTGQSFTAFFYWLTKLLKPEMIFEWGPGQSTHAFLMGDPNVQIISYDDDDQWTQLYKKQLKEYDTKYMDRIEFYTVTGTEDYNNSILPDNSTDIVLVDGVRRNDCFASAERIVKPGGVVVVHDTNSSVLWSKPETELTYYGEHEDPIQGETTSIYIKEEL